MLKKLVFGCLLVVALAVAGIYFAWRQVTRLPEWYSDSVVERPVERPPADEPASFDTRRSTSEPASSRKPVTVDEIRRSSGRVELDERQLNELLVRGLDEHRNGRRAKRAAKAVRASIHGDRIEVGVVTNLADLAAVVEDGSESEVVRRLERFAPWLKGRDFYLAARGKPQARNGNLFFDRDVELVVGGVGFDAADLAARLGLPREEIDSGAELPIPGLHVEDVIVDGDSVVLSLAE